MNRTEFADLDDFYHELRRQQVEAHGLHYDDNHDVLERLGWQCPVQKELGVSQGGTLAAMIRTRPQKLTGIDTDFSRFAPYQKYFDKYANQHGIDFKFVEQNSLCPSTVSACDLLHIDSRHTATHLKQELKLHGPKVNKYIICHDTAKRGALVETLADYAKWAGWKVIEQCNENVGYMVIGRHFGNSRVRGASR